MFTHDNCLKVIRNNDELFFIAMFTFSTEESNVAISTNLEIINTILNGLKKNEMAKDYGLAFKCD